MDTITLAENLKSLRKEHLLTQKELSSYLNVSRQCYSQYESGHRSPDFSTIIRLASLYHVSLDYLFLNPAGPLSVNHCSSEHQNHPSINLQEYEYFYLTQLEINLIKLFRMNKSSTQKKILNFLQHKSLQSCPENKVEKSTSTPSLPQS